MLEQLAHHTVRRASATAEELAARRNTYVDVPEDDSFYPQPRPGSARRYTTTEGNRVIQQGNRRIVIHDEPPPKQKRKFHWLFYVGIVFFAMVIGWIALTLFTNWWQVKQADWKYGNPRTDHHTDTEMASVEDTIYDIEKRLKNLHRLAQEVTDDENFEDIKALMKDLERQKRDAERILFDVAEEEEINDQLNAALDKFEQWAYRVRPLLSSPAYQPTYEEMRLAIKILGIRAEVFPKG